MANLDLSLKRLETVYLTVLRVFILVMASACLLGAAWFAIDGGLHALTPTSVKPKPVSISTSDVTAALLKPAPNPGEDNAEKIPASAKAANDQFLTGAFNSYYDVYKNLAVEYNKPEDRIITREDLMKALGYDVNALVDRSDPSAVRFQEDPAYAAAQVAAIQGLLSDKALLAKLAQYKTAGKTATACGTRFVRQRSWDSNSTTCSDWFETPIGCPVFHDVPVQNCAAAYPDGVASPYDTFARADAAYRQLWAGRNKANADEAAAKHAQREAVRLGGFLKLGIAVQVFGGFVIVMLLFLLIAVESHLRRLAAASCGPTETA